VDLDPLSALYCVWLADLYLVTGQLDRAMDYARNVLDADPNYGPAMSVLGEAYSLMGRDEEGIALLEKGWASMQGANLWDGRLGWAYVRAGRQTDAERFLADIEKRHQQRSAAATVVAMTALALGDVECALRWVRTAFEERDPNLLYTVRTSYLQRLQPDARYQDILRQMNSGV
jgi:predicted Zn-dependent protease